MRTFTAPRRLGTDSLSAFGVFGAFWGAWGASIPRIQRQAGVDDGELGFALLLVGAAALPAMALVGRAVDRFGLRVAGPMLAATGGAGALMSVTAHSLGTLATGLAVVGAASGACDVAINSTAGHAEKEGGGAVITHSHATFSTLVVLTSLGTGGCAAAGAPVWVPFAAVAATSIAVGLRLFVRLPGGAAPRAAAAHAGTDAPRRWALLAPLVPAGVLGALAFASENAHQSWSAVFAHQVLHAGTGVAAGAPAIFAGVVAVTRFLIGRVPFRHAVSVLVAGSVAAAIGAATIAVAPGLGVAALGLAVAAAGTGVLFPTLMRLVGHSVGEDRRGRATAVVTSISYLGFLVGPVYVGTWAGVVGLRGAMLAIAALGGALTLLTRTLIRQAGLVRGPVTTGRAHG